MTFILSDPAKVVVKSVLNMPFSEDMRNKSSDAYKNIVEAYNATVSKRFSFVTKGVNNQRKSFQRSSICLRVCLSVRLFV